MCWRTRRASRTGRSSCLSCRTTRANSSSRTWRACASGSRSGAPRTTHPPAPQLRLHPHWMRMAMLLPPHVGPTRLPPPNDAHTDAQVLLTHSLSRQCLHRLIIVGYQFIISDHLCDPPLSSLSAVCTNDHFSNDNSFNGVLVNSFNGTPVFSRSVSRVPHKNVFCILDFYMNCPILVLNERGSFYLNSGWIQYR